MSVVGDIFRRVGRTRGRETVRRGRTIVFFFLVRARARSRRRTRIRTPCNNTIRPASSERFHGTHTCVHARPSCRFSRDVTGHRYCHRRCVIVIIIVVIITQRLLMMRVSRSSAPMNKRVSCRALPFARPKKPIRSTCGLTSRTCINNGETIHVQRYRRRRWRSGGRVTAKRMERIIIRKKNPKITRPGEIEREREYNNNKDFCRAHNESRRVIAIRSPGHLGVFYAAQSGRPVIATVSFPPPSSCCCCSCRCRFAPALLFPHLAPAADLLSRAVTFS